MDSPTQRASTPLGRASSGSLASYGSGLAPPRTSVLLAKGVGRPGTGLGGSPTTARPMTSSKAAGYTSPARSGTGGAHPSSPTKAGGPGAAPTREQCEALEERVHALLGAAAERAAAGDGPGAVDAAKEAARREQRLCAMLEAAGAGDQISLDLKYAVSVALGAAYEANGQSSDALGVYSQVIKSRLFPNVRGGCCFAWQWHHGEARLHNQHGAADDSIPLPPANRLAAHLALHVPPTQLRDCPSQPPCRPAGCASTWAPSTSRSRTTRQPPSSGAWRWTSRRLPTAACASTRRLGGLGVHLGAACNAAWITD